MGDLSKHFSKHEMWCNCGCRRGVPHPFLLTKLEFLRSLTAAAMYINTRNHRGGSCPEYNAKIGGSLGSYHIVRWDPIIRAELFLAVDFESAVKDPLELARIIEKMDLDIGGQGIYYTISRPGGRVIMKPGFMHWDFGRPKRKDGGRRKWIHFRYGNKTKYIWLPKNRGFLQYSHYQLVDLAVETMNRG